MMRRVGRRPPDAAARRAYASSIARSQAAAKVFGLLLDLSSFRRDFGPRAVSGTEWQTRGDIQSYRGIEKSCWPSRFG